MRLRLSVARPDAAGPPVDVVLAADEGTTLGEVRAAVLGVACAPPGSALLVEGRPLDDAAPVGVPPLVDGVLLVAGPAGPTASADRGGLLELHVVGGPDAGAVHRLAPGRHRLGRSPDCDVRVDDVDVSRVHAVLDVATSGVTVTDLGSTNGTTVDGEPVPTEPRSLPLGAVLRAGSTTLVLRLPPRDAASVRPTRTGALEVNRPPRLPLPPLATTVRFPRRPEPPERRGVPLLAALLPLAVSVPMAVLWSPFALLLGLTSPVMVLGSYLGDRRSGRRRHAEATAGYEAELAEAERRVAELLLAERRQRRRSSPDAATLVVAADVPTSRLWERRPGDADFLLLGVGTGPVASAVTVVRPADGDERENPLLDDAPVGVSLRAAGVVGLCGPRRAVLGLARWLVVQVACLHAPADVGVAVLAAGTAGHDWTWTRWLPHARPDPDAAPWTASGTADVERLAGRLVDELDRRRRGDPAGPGVHRDLVVVLDGARALRAVPGVARLLDDGPALGVHLLCLDETATMLPAECRVVLESAGEVGSRLDVRAPADLGGPDVTPLPGSTVVADAVSAGRAEHVARRLAALRDATPRLADGGLPRQVRLLDVLGLGVPGLDATDPAVVAERWRRGGRSTRAMLGAGRDGVVAPDLRRDGPHVLVGGTTGSGKSELLQTLVTSLAVANRPDELTFLLVDYKGGAAFADCARLPHTVGLVTDLDEHLTRRALTSLGAEVKRRERLLRDAGAADVDHYVERAGPGAMPRLVIVVDEFRVLADELPEFVDGLVRLAAVGRSLGLHLVLATQRPGGVVGPDIAANVNLRIALRVRDRADSTDVVESPEAAAIDASLPGRAVLRTGSGPLVELQTARVSHRQGPVGESRERRPPVVRRELWRGTPPPDERAPEGGDAPTDLARIVDALSDAAGRCGTARPGGLWIPPLPEVLHRAALPSSTEEALVLGLRDEPAAQAQPPAVLRLRPGTALAVVGTARSGRTGVLASVAAAASRVPADRVHLHAVLGSGAAPPGLSGLPQVGTVVGRDDPDRLARLLRRLADEVERRRSSGGPADGAAVVLLVDGWEAAHRLLDDPQHGAALEHLLQVVREGPAVAVSTVLAGDRSLLTGRLASALTQRLLLRTADPTDAVLAGVPVHDLPRVMPPGRGMWVDEHGVAEVQVADPGRLESSVVRPAAGGPFVVRALPRGVAESELRGADAPPLPVGVGGEDVVPVGFTVAECTGLVVAGPPGSGRSTALAVLGRALRRAGVPVVVVAPRASSLADAVPDAVVVRDLHDPVSVGRVCEHRGTVVLVDDVVAAEGSAVLDAVERHLAAGGGTVLAGEPAELAARFRGPVAEARRSRTGLLLSPTGYADGDVLGVSVPRSAAVAPGRGVVVRRGVAQTVQVALPATPQPMGPRDDPSRPGMLTP